MDITSIVVSIALLTCGCVIGIVVSRRQHAAAMAAARESGRAEVCVELATQTERAQNFERQVMAAESRLGGLQQECVATAARASAAEAECSRFAERLNAATQQIAQLQQFSARLEPLGKELSEQRELVSRLTAQLQAAETTCAQAHRALEQTAREKAELVARIETLTVECRTQSEQLAASREKSESLERVNSDHEASRSEMTARCESLQEQIGSLRTSNAELQTALAAERNGAQEKLQLLMTAREDLLQQFKLLSAELLEEKSRKFTEQNALTIGQLLDPVKEKLASFQAKVDEVYRTEGQERAALGEQLKQLLRLNQCLSEDAQNLTRALKGDQKTQGTWGEIVLETVLEQAGLVEGTHFDRQASFEGDEQKRAIPDVVIRLPGDRQLVVDSKVSLTAYERACAANSDEERVTCIKQHVTSLRNHIRSLSEKNYQQLYQLKSLDFVLLFVPLEPAFATAVSNDNQIFREAWERNVILVSPSTLLFVVRTVAYLWRQESQARNVVEIAKRGAALYDKLCGFVEEIETVGKALGRTQKAYDAALRKLAVGDGNVIRQAEMLRDLGIKPSKNLPMPLVDRAISVAQQALLDDQQESTTDAVSVVPAE